jgi:hypothetical protein
MMTENLEVYFNSRYTILHPEQFQSIPTNTDGLPVKLTLAGTEKC